MSFLTILLFPIECFARSLSNITTAENKTFTVELTVSNTGGCKSIAIKNILVHPELNSGLETAEVLSNVTAFPNPASDIVYLKYSLKRPSDIMIELTEPSGKLLKRMMEHQESSGENMTTINIKSYQPGLMFLKVIVNGQTSVFKIIKQ